MNKLKLMSLVMLTALTAYGADNEIYIDQSGATANIDLEQLRFWKYYWWIKFCRRNFNCFRFRWIKSNSRY